MTPNDEGPTTDEAKSVRSVEEIGRGVDRNDRASFRLILLEDNPSVRTATQLFLSLEGYETLSAGSATETDELVASMRRGDMLITDYRLDGTLTGLDVLHQVRSRLDSEVPAILLSGDLESVTRVIKHPIPGLRLLSKPVNTKALLEAIAGLAAEAASRIA
jgi:CheY-like chemotaxis protein